MSEESTPQLSSEDVVRELLQQLAADKVRLAELEAKEAERDQADRQADLEAQEAMKSELTRQSEEPHYWITIHRLGEDDRQDSIYIGVNGVSRWIKKDLRVPLPKSAVEVLKNAVIHSKVLEYDPEQGKRWERPIQINLYPYTNEGEANPEEVLAWKAENSAERVQTVKG